MPRRGTIGALVVACSLAAGNVSADSGPSQAQFDWGLAEMKAGRYATGCPALAESYRLDPMPGALFTLAECEAKWGKISSAVTHYEAYLDLFGRMTDAQKEKQRGRDKFAAAEKDALSPEVPQLTLALGGSVPADAVIKRDREVVGAPSLGVATPVDPGEHVLLVLVSGRPAREIRISLARGEKKRVVLDAPLVEPPAPAYRTWAWASAGVGVAGIATGAVFGLVALGKKSTVDQYCNTANMTCTNLQGKQAADALESNGTASTVAFTVGIFGAAGAAALLLLRPGARVNSTLATLVIHGDPRGGFVGVARSF